MYQDGVAIIVIDKPVNLLSIASVAEQEKTAYAYLTDYVRKGDTWSQERVWIVHRLDRETSGLMIFAHRGGQERTAGRMGQRGKD